MGLFNSGSKQQLKNINGYIIDELTGMLIDVPKGLQIYNIPKEVKQLDPNLNLMANKVLSNMSSASEIIFEDGSIDKIPDGYFTFGSSFSNLKRLTLPNGIKNLGNNCIDSMKTKYNLPISIEHLGTGIYPETQKLVLGNNIKTLGTGFASHDTNLVYVEVPGTIKELPVMFVNQCKNLKNLILHEGVEKAGNMAFRGLNSLEYVEIPDSFKMPFQTSMENRSGSNKRGNSRYDGTNGVFEAQQNSVLTIRKTHNGIPYTFQVRKGDFAEISFQNTSAVIKSTDGKNINIDLGKLNQNIICQVNMQELRIQQVSIHQPQQPIQNQKSMEQSPVQSKPQFQQQVPIQPGNTVPKPMSQINPQQKLEPSSKQGKSTDGDPEVEINSYFQKLYKEGFIPTDIFKNLNLDGKGKLELKRLMQYEFSKKAKKYPNFLKESTIFLENSMLDILEDLESKSKAAGINLADYIQQQIIIADNQVVPIEAIQSNQEKIERLQNIKQQIIDSQPSKEEEIDQDQGMSM